MNRAAAERKFASRMAEAANRIAHTVRIPASSANLGPGFDALGLALGIYLECRFSPARELSISVTGRDAAMISTDSDNLIWQTALDVARDNGGGQFPYG